MNQTYMNREIIQVYPLRFNVIGFLIVMQYTVYISASGTMSYGVAGRENRSIATSEGVKWLDAMTELGKIYTESKTKLPGSIALL